MKKNFLSELLFPYFFFFAFALVCLRRFSSHTNKGPRFPAIKNVSWSITPFFLISRQSLTYRRRAFRHQHIIAGRTNCVPVSRLISVWKSIAIKCRNFIAINYWLSKKSEAIRDESLTESQHSQKKNKERESTNKLHIEAGHCFFGPIYCKQLCWIGHDVVDPQNARNCSAELGTQKIIENRMQERVEKRKLDENACCFRTHGRQPRG